MYVRQLQLGPMENFVYLFGAEGEREVAVVDPAWEVDAILEAAQEDGKEISTILLTHHHHDHVNGVEPLLARKPGLPIVAQAEEIAFSTVLQRFGDLLRPVAPDEVVKVGSLEVRCIHTPGHTPGANSLYAGGSLFSGDTLFINGCGRCDLKGGDPEKMFHSLHRVLAALPDETVLYPGHDYADKPVSTMGDEKRDNPYYQRKTLEDFVAYRMRPR